MIQVKYGDYNGMYLEIVWCRGIRSKLDGFQLVTADPFGLNESWSGHCKEHTSILIRYLE